MSWSELLKSVNDAFFRDICVNQDHARVLKTIGSFLYDVDMKLNELDDDVLELLYSRALHEASLTMHFLRRYFTDKTPIITMRWLAFCSLL